MEDHREEFWEIEEEYLTSYEDYPPSDDCKSNSKIGWIWRKGLSFGKKAVVTGAVISSAPLVIPPILALSALGVAFSVPAGFAFVTYACTDKIVNYLVPVQPPKSEKLTVYSDEEYETVSEDDLEKGYEEDVDMEAEEKEFEKDTKKGVELRMAFADEDAYGQDYFTIEDEFRPRTTVVEIVEEGGYEEDDGEYMELEEHDGEYMEREEQPLNSSAAHEVLKGIREAEDEISSERGSADIPADSVQAVVVEAEVSGENENDVEQVLENLAYVAARNLNDEEIGHTEPFTGIDEEEMRQETTALLEELRDADDQKWQGREARDIARKDAEEGAVPVTDMSEDKGNKNLFIIPEEVRPERDVHIQSDVCQDREATEIDKKDEGEGDVPITDMNEDKGNKNLFVIPELLRPERDVQISTDDWQDREETEMAKKDEGEGDVPIIDMNQDKGNKNLFVIQEQVRPGIDIQISTDDWQDREETVPMTDLNQDKENKNLFVNPDQVRPERDVQMLSDVWEDREATEIDKKDDGEGTVPITYNQDLENKNLFVIPEEVRPDRDVQLYEAHDGVNWTHQEESEREMKEPKLIVEKKLVVQVKTCNGHTATDVRQETGSELKTGTLVLSSEDAREMADESGFDFTDDTHESYDNVSDLVDQKAAEEHISLEKLIVNVDYHEVPVRRPAVTPSDQVSTASSSDKLQVSEAEKKIWEQINAIRTIVGYTVAANMSCAEELKALYVFTGVEPPAPSGNSDSLMNVSEKLHFLMSIIGVK